MTDEDKIKKIKKILKKYLKDKNLYEDIDITLLEELYFNIKIANKCKKEIEDEGHKLDCEASKYGDKIINKSFIIYLDCLRNINSILMSLSLTPRERNKFRSIVQTEDDFDDLMNN